MKYLIAALSLLGAVPALAQSYEEKVIAAILMAEAWNQGYQGMLAVAEVISTRSLEKKQAPLKTVTKRRAFSCLNRSNPDRLVRKFAGKPDFAKALDLARTVCREPQKLPGITKAANHFTRVEEKPIWARGRKPVAVIKDHAFYRIAPY